MLSLTNLLEGFFSFLDGSRLRRAHVPVRPQISNFSESLQSHPVISRVNGGAGTCMSTEMPYMDGGWLTVTWGVISKKEPQTASSIVANSSGGGDEGRGGA